MLSFIDNDDTLICKFRSRLDTFNSQKLENELNTRIAESNKTIIFDLEEVVFVSSYFLRICINTLKTIGTEKFKLQNVKSDIKKVFMIAGYDKYMNIM